jgi:hypothetical protein
MKILSLVTVLSALGSTSASPFKRNALITAVSHGGANPLTPVAAAKMSGVLSIAQGAYLTLAPSKSLQMYGVEEEITNPINVKLLRRTGLLILNMGVYVYCLIFKDNGIRASVAINSLMFVVETLSSLFNNESETIGPSKAFDLSFLAVTGSTAYAALNNLECFNPLFKVYSVYITIVGLLDYFSPQQTRNWFETAGHDEMTPGIVTIIGSACLMLGTLTTSLAWGVAPIDAIGYTAAVSAVLDLKGIFFSPEMEDTGINKGALAFWPVWNTGVAASIFL